MKNALMRTAVPLLILASVAATVGGWLYAGRSIQPPSLSPDGWLTLSDLHVFPDLLPILVGLLVGFSLVVAATHILRLRGESEFVGLAAFVVTAAASILGLAAPGIYLPDALTSEGSPRVVQTWVAERYGLPISEAAAADALEAIEEGQGVRVELQTPSGYVYLESREMDGEDPFLVVDPETGEEYGTREGVRTVVDHGVESDG